MSSRFTIPRGAFAEFSLGEQGMKVVDALSESLGAAVWLYDEEKQQPCAVARSAGRLLFFNGKLDVTEMCSVQARVNDRWMLTASSRSRLHPDAEAIVKWAAARLAPYVPRKSEEKDPTSPPFGGGGGGSSGSAEAGIPVWWARKTRN
jgi:hypothetical protein